MGGPARPAKRGGGLALEFPLQFEWQGRSQHARTVVVESHSALILSPVACKPGVELDIRNLATGLEGRFRVVWSWVENGRDYHCRLSVELLDPRLAFWDVPHALTRRAR